MRGNDVRQDLLQDVVRLGLTHQVAWYIVCIDVIPPMPVPCVEATRLGCTQRINSFGGVKPEDRNASTVATMFHSATRSIELAMSG